MYGTYKRLFVVQCTLIKHSSNKLVNCAGAVKRSSVPTIYPQYPSWKMHWLKKRPRRAIVWRWHVVRTLHYRLRWYGHVLWKEDNIWVKKCM